MINFVRGMDNFKRIAWMDHPKDIIYHDVSHGNYLTTLEFNYKYLYGSRLFFGTVEEYAYGVRMTMRLPTSFFRRIRTMLDISLLTYSTTRTTTFATSK